MEKLRKDLYKTQTLGTNLLSKSLLCINLNNLEKNFYKHIDNYRHAFLELESFLGGCNPQSTPMLFKILVNEKLSLKDPRPLMGPKILAHSLNYFFWLRAWAIRVCIMDIRKHGKSAFKDENIGNIKRRVCIKYYIPNTLYTRVFVRQTI